jgi:hypothetical protein
MGVNHDDALTVAAYLYAIQPDGTVAGLDSGASVPAPEPVDASSVPPDTGGASPAPDGGNSSYTTGDGSSGDGG